MKDKENDIITNENKFREEIFKLIDEALDGIKLEESKLLKELFLTDEIDNKTLIDKIKKL